MKGHARAAGSKLARSVLIAEPKSELMHFTAHIVVHGFRRQKTLSLVLTPNFRLRFLALAVEEVYV
jgi:hypothetical protein